ncbi:hypothetical protein I2F27_01790 [Acinetobacter sp. B5B]|uniref:hypothetical protein n=1 Tax=Acinetobacter baretiae TaxID=2605383 RepID=UPI0018C2E16F|nr:hypothetical protein [Acinetobacter baretiae]MBF7682071.1 hypothetical protein [Acinetobacter baretiae]MBF7684689.1 hypothetical protein [Acinetobacter baretiae]
MSKNLFEQKITKKLNALADQHPSTPQVISHVLEHIQDRKKPKKQVWKVTSLAFAAVLASVAITPNILQFMNKNDETTQTVMATSDKLSPQMVEDLEMVMVFGENVPRHGS